MSAKIAGRRPTREGLTEKQAAFVREYLVDKNATQAAIRAGYSARTAGAIGDEILKKPEIAALVRAGLDALAKKTETDAEWVRRRLREEAEDFTEFASHSARIRAIELIARLNGLFEVDNGQQNPLLSLFNRLDGNVIRPGDGSGEDE